MNEEQQIEYVIVNGRKRVRMKVDNYDSNGLWSKVAYILDSTWGYEVENDEMIFPFDDCLHEVKV